MFHTVVQRLLKVARIIVFILYIIQCCFQQLRLFKIGLQLMKLLQKFDTTFFECICRYIMYILHNFMYVLLSVHSTEQF